MFRPKKIPCAHCFIEVINPHHFIGLNYFDSKFYLCKKCYDKLQEKLGTIRGHEDRHHLWRTIVLNFVHKVDEYNKRREKI